MARAGVSIMAQYFKRATDLIELGVELDKAGVSDIFVTESFNEVPTSLTALAIKTTQARLGSAIAILFLRHPHTLALAAATIDDLSGGRLTLGIGTGHHSMHTRLGLRTEKPYTQTKEYLDCLQAVMDGSQPVIDAGGEFFKATGRRSHWTPANKVPIMLAALGDKMVALGCGQGDGIITSLCTLEQMRGFRAKANAAAVAAGKRPEDVTIYAVLHAAIRDSRDEALALGRTGMPYSAAPFYQQEFARNGVSAPGGVLDDAGVDQIAIAGPVSFAKERLAAWREAGVDVPLLAPMSTEPDPVAAYRSFLPLLR